MSTPTFNPQMALWLREQITSGKYKSLDEIPAEDLKAQLVQAMEANREYHLVSMRRMATTDPVLLAHEHGWSMDEAIAANKKYMDKSPERHFDESLEALKDKPADECKASQIEKLSGLRQRINRHERD